MHDEHQVHDDYDPAQVTVSREGDAARNRLRDCMNGLRPGLHKSGRMNGLLPRCLIIGIITLVLLFPLSMVRNVVYERMDLQREATQNIIASWGRAQSVSGPVLIVPYETWKDRTERVKVRKDDDTEEYKEVVKREYTSRHKVMLPSEVQFDVTLDPEVRYRGIYRQALYNAPVTIQGVFELPEAQRFASNVHRVLWEQAWISVGITDLKTISEAGPTMWQGRELPPYKPGSNAGALVGPGFHTPVSLNKNDAGTRQNFSLQLHIRGSGGISFTPVGEKTTITAGGSWPAPSFQGNLLPVERTISDNGFSAKWVISNLTRTYPQMADYDSPVFTSNQSSGSVITEFTAGVDLHEPVSLYRMLLRSVNYGILFIAVTFVALFAFEMLSRQRMHLIQYGMVGLSMSIFYLVLLSLAEHVSFGLSFVAATGVTVLMNSAYVASVLHNRRKGAVLGGLLCALYAVLFSLLRMEDFALLVGTALVLVMMGGLMFVTRNLPQAGADGDGSGAATPA